MNGAVKVVEKAAPALKDGVFVLIQCKLIVDVVEPESLVVLPVLCETDAGRVHLTVRDRILCARGGVDTSAPPVQHKGFLLLSGHWIVICVVSHWMYPPQ